LRHTRFLAAAGALALTGALLGACGGGSGGDTLTLYNGQHVQTTAALVSAFERQTGITVQVRSADEDVLVNQVEQEGSASPADLIYAENSPALESLQGKGMLAPVDASILARVPSRYSSPDGDWVGVSARVSVLVYNTSDLRPDQLPASVMDLARPEWRGKLALAPGETDFQPIVTSVVKTYGEDAALRWLEGVKANAAGHIYPDNETVTNMVNRGEAELGVVNQYYWYRERYEVGASSMHSAIAYFSPGDAGYVLDVSGAGVLKSSGHKQAAQRFLAFLVSQQGQEIVARSHSYEYPLVPGVAAAGPEQPLGSLEPAPLSVADLGDGSLAVSLLQRVQLL
jgi:iron(III) transport system substrate-binding protein